MFVKSDEGSATDYCIRNCYEETDQVKGLWIDDRGIMHATKCLKCETVTIAESPGNPFDEVNRKLDMILRKFGYDV